MDERAGQHHGVFATALGKNVPPDTEPAPPPRSPPVSNHLSVFGITCMVPSSRWSSVTITSTFGAASAAAGLEPPTTTASTSSRARAGHEVPRRGDELRISPPSDRNLE